MSTGTPPMRPLDTRKYFKLSMSTSEHARST
jgi:hypothetical protein